MAHALAKRIYWIDNAKGIGILLVVLGHIWLIGTGNKLIYSFHMPLFFFFSGYLFNKSKYNSFLPFFIKRIRTILIPYAIFSFVTYGYWVLIERHLTKSAISPISVFINIFTSQGADDYLPHNPALWFLPCLFVVEILFYPIGGLSKRLIILLVSIGGALGYALSLYTPSVFPWSIDVALTGIVFFGVGYICNSSLPSLTKRNGWALIAGVLFCIPIGIFCALANKPISMASNIYGAFYLFYPAAFCGIFTLIFLLIRQGYNPVLSFLGSNSLLILVLHIPVKRLVMGISSIALHVPITTVKASFLISAFDTVVVMAILYPIILLVNTYFPYVLGKAKGRSGLSSREAVGGTIVVDAKTGSIDRTPLELTATSPDNHG